jgi:potassium-transporting ATPase KdpC subunit
MLKLARTALILFVFFTVLTGLVYPLVVTGISQIIFPQQANGSLMTKDGQVVGSSLIGQSFDDPKYFWGRLSATGGNAYNAAASSGSNLSALNPALEKQAADRLAALQDADPGNTQAVPVDLVTASGSGLDPHISVAAARYQAARVAAQRGLAVERVQSLIDQHIEDRQLGLLGEPRVNVLALNLALDALQ